MESQFQVTYIANELPRYFQGKVMWLVSMFMWASFKRGCPKPNGLSSSSPLNGCLGSIPNVLCSWGNPCVLLWIFMRSFLLLIFPCLSRHLLIGRESKSRPGWCFDTKDICKTNLDMTLKIITSQKGWMLWLFDILIGLVRCWEPLGNILTGNGFYHETWGCPVPNISQENQSNVHRISPDFSIDVFPIQPERSSKMPRFLADLALKEMGQDSGDIQAGFERLNTARSGAQGLWATPTWRCFSWLCIAKISLKVS